MKEKIAILTYSLAGAGAERIAANLLNHLDSERYDIHLVMMNTEIEYTICPDQVIHYIEKSNRYEKEWLKFIKIPWLSYKFARYCNKEKIPLVLAIMNRPNLIASMAKMFGIKAKVLISERCYTPYTYNKDSFAGTIKYHLLKWIYPKADAILPNSLGTVEALKNYFQIKSQYFVVKNPTDMQRIKALMHENTPVQMDNERFKFLYVATFREEKNQDLLVDAVAQMLEEDFQLVFIGKGPTLNRIQEKVKNLGVGHKIMFIDFTPNPYMYMKRADCFLLSSFSEGFPNVLIESMACGLPIISVDCKTGPRELLAPRTPVNTVVQEDCFEIAEYGILTAPASVPSMVKAMKWALGNKETLKAYKCSIVNKANDFEIEKVCHEFSAIFDSYLKKKGK
jgi:N-acetylgalactosamine-N,N'-diacetylbacillosaminyl-diphospho-undecaprenol 4-alpha-N-acetylgalactosaminyltransferase